jgi:hypothetical protein
MSVMNFIRCSFPNDKYQLIHVSGSFNGIVIRNNRDEIIVDMYEMYYARIECLKATSEM